MQRIFFVIVLFFCVTTLFAQKTVVKGRVYDSIIQNGLAYTTVSLVRAGDSTLVSFARADSSGFFQLNAIEKGKYLVSTSYVGYIPVWKTIEVSGASVQNIGDGGSYRGV